MRSTDVPKKKMNYLSQQLLENPNPSIRIKKKDLGLKATRERDFQNGYYLPGCIKLKKN